MLEALFQALSAGLSIWESKEKTKYVDRLLSLKKEWYAEYNKDPKDRDDAVLDTVQRELRDLVSEWSNIIGSKNS